MTTKRAFRRVLVQPLLLITVASMSSVIRISHGQAGVQPDSSAAQYLPVPLPDYEVAAIKPANGGNGMHFVAHTPTGLTVRNEPVQFLIREAFGLDDDRILGAPGWVKTARFDIEAKVDESNAPGLKKLTVHERRLMLRPFLEERFHLKFHYETKVLPVYALVIAKGGSKMKEFVPPGDPARNGLRYTGRGHVEARGTSMEFVVPVLSQQVGRTVLDKTGLLGKYDFTLEWEPDDAPPILTGSNESALPPDSIGSSLFTAIQEQLGLKLESQKGPVSVLVIDTIELPSPN